MTSDLLILENAESEVVKCNAYYTEMKLVVEHCTAIWARLLFLNDFVLTSLSSVRQMHVKLGFVESSIKARISSKIKEGEKLVMQLSGGAGGDLSNVQLMLKQLRDAETGWTPNVTNGIQMGLVSNDINGDINGDTNGGPFTSGGGSLLTNNSNIPTLPSTIKQEAIKRVVKICKKSRTQAFEAADILLKIVDGDVSNANELTSICSSLKKRHREVVNLADYLGNCLAQFIEFVPKLSNELKTTQLEMEVVKKLWTKISQLIKGVDSEYTSIQMLIKERERHALGVRVWESELERRKQSDLKLFKLIEHMNRALKQHYSTEVEERKRFCRMFETEYGNEIEGIDKLPYKYTVEYNPEFDME